MHTSVTSDVIGTSAPARGSVTSQVECRTGPAVDAGLVIAQLLATPDTANTKLARIREICAKDDDLYEAADLLYGIKRALDDEGDTK